MLVSTLEKVGILNVEGSWVTLADRKWVEGSRVRMLRRPERPVKRLADETHESGQLGNPHGVDRTISDGISTQRRQRWIELDRCP
jgi:hypothetical protein